jgi:lipopolysaccharide transport system permease protein
MEAPSIREAAQPSAVGSQDATTVRRPANTRLRIGNLHQQWPVVRALASRDLKARYKQSALGPAWLVLQPAALLVAFGVGFRSVVHVGTAGVPYLVFALTGLVAWTYFQATTMVAVGSIVNNYALVRWTACPRTALPLATLISNLPSFVITFVASLIAAAFAGYASINWFVLPLLFVWLVLLVAAGALFLSALSVRARDVLSVMPFLLQVMLFLSPVAYRTSQVSPVARALISLNPITGLIDAWRWSLLGIAPSLIAMAISLSLTAIGAIVAWRSFVRFEIRMADEI